MRVHSVRLIAAAAVAFAVSSVPAQAQNFFTGSAETIRDRYFRLTGAPVVMFGRDDAPDRTGGAFRLGYGITDAFDVEAKTAFFDGVTLIGGDGQFRVFADDNVLVSVRAGGHQALMSNAPDSTALQATIEAVNLALRHRLGYPQVSRRRGAFERTYQTEIKNPNQLLGLLAEAASDLLTACDPSLVKKCQNPACVLFFYDTTKNHARHWCSMSLCGNRSKVAALYQRHRQRKT